MTGLRFSSPPPRPPLSSCSSFRGRHHVLMLANLNRERREREIKMQVSIGSDQKPIGWLFSKGRHQELRSERTAWCCHPYTKRKKLFVSVVDRWHTYRSLSSQWWCGSTGITMVTTVWYSTIDKYAHATERSTPKYTFPIGGMPYPLVDSARTQRPLRH